MRNTIIIYMVICVSMKYAVCTTTLRDILIPTTTPQNPEDRAELEHGPGYDTYEHEQMEVAKERGIIPLVDTIREKDKYGNNGEHVIKIFTKVFEDASDSVSRSLGFQEPNTDTVNLLEGLNPLLENFGYRLAGLA